MIKFRGIGESSCGLIDYSGDGNLSLNTKHNTFKILKLQSAMTKNGIDRLKRLQEEISSTHDSTKNNLKLNYKMILQVDCLILIIVTTVIIMIVSMVIGAKMIGMTTGMTKTNSEIQPQL